MTVKEYFDITTIEKAVYTVTSWDEEGGHCYRNLTRKDILESFGERTLSYKNVLIQMKSLPKTAYAELCVHIELMKGEN